MRYCLVLDSHYGVFVGMVDWSRWSQDPCGWILVTDFRHCYSYTTTNGVYELAVSGPPAGSRVGVVVPAAIVRDVTKIVPCSVNAELAFREAIWTR